MGRNFNIKKSDWLPCYQSIILLGFFIDQYSKQESIEIFDKALNKYAEQNGFSTNGKLSIIDQQTVEVLIYTVLARIHEVTINADKEAFYKCVIVALESYFSELNNYSSILKKYGFEIKCDDWADQKDEKRLQQLVRAIRNKIVHFDNESDKENMWIKFTDEDKSKHLHFRIKTAGMLNFCLYLGVAANRVIHNQT